MEDEIIFFSQWCKDWLQDIERAFFDEEGAESKTGRRLGQPILIACDTLTIEMKSAKSGTDRYTLENSRARPFAEALKEAFACASITPRVFWNFRRHR